MAYVKIRPRRGSKSQWEYANPILSEGEMAFEVPETGVGTGLINIKQGDGQNAWNSLPYAFNGSTLDTKIDELSNTVASYNSRITNVEQTVGEMVQTVQFVRRIDIQAAEPTIDNDSHPGQIWIDSDTITGTANFSALAINVKAGEQYVDPDGGTVRLNLTGDFAQSNFEKIFQLSNETTASIRTDASTQSSIKVYITGVQPGSCTLYCLVKSGNAIVGRASMGITVTAGGAITITPPTGFNGRLIMGNVIRCNLSGLEAINYDTIQWSSSASYYASVAPVSDPPGNKAANVTGVLSTPEGDHVTIYARAYLNGNLVTEAYLEIIVAGIVMREGTVTIDIGELHHLYLDNTMKKTLGDYTDILWKVTPEETPRKVTLSNAGDTGADITGAVAGTCYVTASAMKNDQVIQTAQCVVRVEGTIDVSPSTASRNVGETASFTLVSTMGPTDFDTIAWESDNTNIIEISGAANESVCNINCVGEGSADLFVTVSKNGAPVASAYATVTVSRAPTAFAMVPPSINIRRSGSSGEVYFEELQLQTNLSSSDYDDLTWSVTDQGIKWVLTDTDPADPLKRRVCGGPRDYTTAGQQGTVTVRALKGSSVVAQTTCALTLIE